MKNTMSISAWTRLILKSLGLAILYGLVCIAIPVFMASTDTDWGWDIVPYLFAASIALFIGLARRKSKVWIWGLVGSPVAAIVLNIMYNLHWHRFVGLEKIINLPSSRGTPAFIFTTLWILVSIAIVASASNRKEFIQLVTAAVSAALAVFLIMTIIPSFMEKLFDVFSGNTFVITNSGLARSVSKESIFVIVIMTGALAFAVGFLPFLLVFRYGHFFRVEEVKRLTDQDALAQIVKNEQTDLKIRNVALANVNDQKTLADLIQKIANFDLRMEALQKLEDRKALAEIAENEENQYIRQYAEDKLERLS